MPQELFQGSDTATWHSSIPSLLVPSIYTSRKVLSWLLSNSGIEWQGEEATGTGYLGQAENWKTKSLAGQSILYYLFYLLTTTFYLSTGKYVPSPVQRQAKSLSCCCSLWQLTSVQQMTLQGTLFFVCLKHINVSEFLLSH